MTKKEIRDSIKDYKKQRIQLAVKIKSLVTELKKPQPKKPRNIMDRVKSYETACEVLNLIPNVQFIDVVKEHYDSLCATMKLRIIAQALNEGWKPDWNDLSEYKYYPYFDMRSGFGFSNTTYDCTGTDTAVGSRLCFKSRELAEYAGTKFIKLYEQMLTK